MLKRYTHLQPAALHKRLDAQAKEATPAPSPSAAQAVFASAMALIVEDPVLNGAPRFRGAPLLVQPIAGLLHRGITDAVILADFPDLRLDMLVAARLHRALSIYPLRALSA